MLATKWIVVILAAMIIVVITSVSILLFWKFGTDKNESANISHVTSSPTPLISNTPAPDFNVAITLQYRTQPTFQVSIKSIATTTEATNLTQFAPKENLFSILKISTNNQVVNEVRISLPASPESKETVLIIDSSQTESGTIEILTPFGTLLATTPFNIRSIAAQQSADPQFQSSTTAFLTETKKITTIPQLYRPSDLNLGCKLPSDCYNDHRANGVRFSPTGSKVAYRQENSPPEYDARGSWHMALNDSVIGSHVTTTNVLDRKEGVPVFSDNGEHVAYAITDKDPAPDQAVVYLDGKEYLRTSGTVSENWLNFWPDSSDLWYYPGDRETLYRNDQKVTLTDPLPRSGASFTFINGEILAYQATLNLEGKAIVDAWCEAGIPQKDCTTLQNFVACVEQAGGGYGGLACFQEDDQIILDKYMHDTYPDGSVTYWVFLNKNGDVVRTSQRFVSGQFLGSTIDTEGIVYSVVYKDPFDQNSTRVYVKETASEIQELFALSRPLENVLAISPDQSKIASSVSQENPATGFHDETLYINGKEVGVYGQVEQFTFSSDSQHYLHISTDKSVSKSDFHLIVDGAKYTSDRSVSWAIFAPQSNTPIMSATMPGDQTKRMISIGKELTSQPYDNIYLDYNSARNLYPNLSPDKKYIGVGARLGQELWWVTLKLP